MHHTDPRELLAAIADVLNRLKIPYLVSGGIAVLVWGRPRFTADIDIVVELQKPNAEKLKQALLSLGKSGYLDVDVMHEAIEKSGEFNFIDGETGVKVDFWVANISSQFDVQRLKRTFIKNLNGVDVKFTSPEDLILIKAKWYAESHSSKQLEDIKSIYIISGNQLDKKYIAEMANKMGLAGVLKDIQS